MVYCEIPEENKDWQATIYTLYFFLSYILVTLPRFLYIFLVGYSMIAKEYIKGGIFSCMSLGILTNGHI